MKRFIYLLSTIIFIVSILSTSANGVSYETPFEVDGYTYEDMDLLQKQIDEKEDLMAAAKEMEQAARTLGYSTSHEIIVVAREEYSAYKQERDSLQTSYNQLLNKWNVKCREYPEASLIWDSLKNAGYSNYVCAGILGNIMTEVGGNTLAIQPHLQTADYYGVCQWSSYYPEAWGLSVEGQCDFLIDTIEQEINGFGYLYKKDLTYQDFISMTDCRQIALCFAKAYERCSPESYFVRQGNAVTAYNYFVS